MTGSPGASASAWWPPASIRKWHRRRSRTIPAPRLVAVAGGAPLLPPVPAQSAPAVAYPVPPPSNVVALENTLVGPFVAAPQQSGHDAGGAHGGTQSVRAPAQWAVYPPHRPRRRPPPPACTAPSIVRTVTSALRRTQPGQDPVRAEPQIGQEPPTHGAGSPGPWPEPEAGGLDIPAFLRRQSS
ncbi:MAG: hypothetical protein WDN04_05770 [Rhodospirillales bacterium]